MRLAQVVLATLVLLLSIAGSLAATTTTTNEIASTGSSTLKTTKLNATTSRIEITSKNATATISSLRKFLATQLLNRTSTTAEERVSTSGAGARIGAGGTVVSTSTSGGKTVTVTIYNNNGLLQKIQRWWKKLFSRSSLTRRLRQPTKP